MRDHLLEYFHLDVIRWDFCQSSLKSEGSGWGTEGTKTDPSLFVLSFLPACPLAIANLLSVSVDFPVGGFRYEWNYTVCGPLCLASFN